MAIGDLFHLTLSQTVDGAGEPIITNWFYAAVDILGGAKGLFDAFTKDNGMLEKINTMQSDHMKNASIRVINLFSLTDFYEAAVAGEGAWDADMLPANNTLTLTKKLDTRGVGAGRVSISGLVKDQVTTNVITGATNIAQMNALATAMAADAVEPLGAVFDPVVIKRVKYVLDEGTDDERDAYRLPANAGEANYGHIVSVLVKLKVGHIDTRTNGR